MKYTLIQSSSANQSNRFNVRFDIIQGDRSPAGYPVGYEGKDWHRTEYVDLHRGDAIDLLSRLNAAKS